MIQKHLIRPDRLRQVPPSFSWVDHRLVRHRHLEACDCRALALYLFLVTVSDVQGLSYYSDTAICRHLNLQPEQLKHARAQLRQADLIASNARCTKCSLCPNRLPPARSLTRNEPAKPNRSARSSIASCKEVANDRL